MIVRMIICTVTYTFACSRLLVADSIVYLQVLYAALCLLPIGWVTGTLPPLDSMWVWFMEQIHARLLGGSVMGTELRYIFMHACVGTIDNISMNL